MDIVTCYCESWDTPLRTSKHHYLERLAEKGHRILYIEIPFNPLSVLKRPGEFLDNILPRYRAGVRQVKNNIWAMTGFFPLPYHRGLGGVFDREVLNSLNQKYFLPRLRRAMAYLDIREPIILNYYPLAYPVLSKMNPRRVVFHMVDEWQGMAGIPNSMAKLTSKMISHSDVTIVTSKRLLERYRKIRKDVVLLRHGTDLGLFGPVSTGNVKPSGRVTALSGIKVGYYGALQKLDFQLISQVAAGKPDWNFIFLGPISGAQGAKLANKLPPNVLIWDAWKRDELPSFLAGIDLFWMPFMKNELTESMCPIKLFEVLGTGLPIVSTDLEETRSVAGSMIAYAIDIEEHLAVLQKSLSQNTSALKEKRVKLVSSYDWSVRINEFEELLFGSSGCRN